ncbi:12579_t:CDS:2 [Acaulospora morrowiae]|uniref:12579_t:CDS:1 n=1 Tax=Acaulospora morrowiae TaxID=94023 RepID=A0A9N9CSA9_9GLOM|nr:12579_t:CDS:2 [Acaulospora morrowiae]
MDEPTRSDDEVVSMDLDSDFPDLLDNESSITGDQAGCEVSDKANESDKNKNRIKQKSTQATQQVTLPDSGVTIQEQNLDKLGSKKRQPDSVDTRSTLNKTQSVSDNNEMESREAQKKANGCRIKFNRNLPRLKLNVRNVHESVNMNSETGTLSNKNVQESTNVISETGTRSRKSVDLTAQPGKNANVTDGNIIREENKGKSFKSKESRLESSGTPSKSQKEKREFANTPNNESTKLTSSTVFTQTQKVPPLVVQQAQNMQTPPFKPNQPSVVSQQRPKFKTSQLLKNTSQMSPAVSHKQPNIKQTTTTSVLQQCRPNNNVRQLSATIQSNYRSSRELTINNNSQYLQHQPYRPVQTPPNISQQNAQETHNNHKQQSGSQQLPNDFQQPINNHQYVQPLSAMNGNSRFGPPSSNAQRSSMNNQTPFRLQQQVNYHQFNQYQAGQHPYRSNQQQSRQNVQPSHVPSRLSHSRSNGLPTRNHQPIPSATRYDPRDKNQHNKPQHNEIRLDQRSSKSSPPKLYSNISTVSQDLQAKSKTSEVNKANRDVTMPNSDKSRSDNINNSSVTSSLKENDLTKVVRSEVNGVDKTNFDSSVVASTKEPDRSNVDNQQGLPNQDEATKLVESSSDNNENGVNCNATDQFENLEKTKKVDKGKKVLVEIDKDVIENAEDPSSNAEVDFSQSDEVELLPSVLEKYRALDEALYEFDEAAQMAYSAYQNLEKFLPPGTVINIAPPSSFKWNIIAEVMGISKKRKISGSFSVHDTPDEMNGYQTQNSSMEEGEIRDFTVRKKNKKSSRNDGKQSEINVSGNEQYNGEDEDEDESMDECTSESRIFEASNAEKIHNTRSRRTPSVSLRDNKNVELATSSQIKLKIKSDLNETGETLSEVKKTSFDNQTEPGAIKMGKKKTPKAKFINPGKDLKWPQNAFGIFCSEYYDQLVKVNEEITSIQFYKSAAEQWTNIALEQKKIYEQKRLNLFAQHTQPRFSVSMGTDA